MVIFLEFWIQESRSRLNWPNLTHSPGANVIKLFTAVIYCHSMVIPLFCVIKLYHLGNYHGMAVNYHGIKLF